jgi:type II secretory pathway predicted ATPase ExeA
MYDEFYGFSEGPFNVTPDPKFLFLTPDHQEALAAMIYGIRERKGFIAITGEVGTGKTTLIYTLLKQIEKRVKAVFIFHTHITFEQLLISILQELDLSIVEKEKTALLRLLNEYLIQRLTRDENLVIIIDEAQNLSNEVMEGLRMLSNLETPKSKLLQIILVGQPELEIKLDSEDLRQLKQRVEIRRRIRPLSHEECPKYIEHRLNLVGSSSRKLFTPEALSLISDHSGGIPRTVNIICDNALLIGYGMNQKVIDEKIVHEVLKDVGSSVLEGSVSGQSVPEDIPQLSPSSALPLKPRDPMGPGSENLSFISSFLIEFIPYLRNTLGSIGTLTRHSMDKFEDKEFGKSFYGSISEDIRKIDSVLSGLLNYIGIRSPAGTRRSLSRLVLKGLLNYISINKPIRKANTVHLIVEGILEEYQRQLEKKKIKVLRRFERDLPETVLQDGELEYIIDSLLQYTVLSTSPGGTIGLLTRSSDGKKEMGDSKDRKLVEILVVFNGDKERETLSAEQEEKALDLILLLVKGLLQKRGGRMTYEVHEKQLKRSISLKFPAERRQRVYFPLLNV